MFVTPFIATNTTSNPGNDVVIGGGTGQGTPDDEMPVSPCSYSFWLEHFGEDIIQGDGINEDDFALWWESNGFSQADWEELNPDLPWGDYFDE